MMGHPVMPLGEPFVSEWSNRSGWNKGDYNGRSDRSDLSEKKPLADPFVEEWLKTAATRKPEASPLVQHLTIPEVRSQLMKGAELLSQLGSAHQALRGALSREDAEEWKRLKGKAELDMAAFLEVRERLGAPGLQDNLAKKMARIRSLRDRKKRRLREKKEDWKKSLEKAERVTEEWIKAKEQAALKMKMEKAVHASASGVLEEVKKKKTDVQQLLKLAEALKELRSLRREQSRKKGDAPPIEADEKFQRTQEALVEMLTQQSEVYRREEHALQVLLEEEVLEKMHSHQKEASSHARPQPPALWPHPALPTSDPWPQTTSDPWEACTNFYLCARSSKEAMVAIRSDWDSYISPHGSTLPDLVAPPPDGIL